MGETDSYELLWAIPDSFADGTYTLRAQITGTDKFENRTITINNDEPPGPDPMDPAPPDTDPASLPAETAEMTRPLAGPAPFTKGATPVAGIASAGAEAVEFFYTKTAARDTRNASAWVQCGRAPLSGTGDAPQAFSGSCTLAASDQASQVTGIAVITVDCDPDLGCPSDANPIGGEVFDSGDAHRVFGIESSPLITIEPAEAEAEVGTCTPFDLRVVDQTGQPLGQQNVDVHVTGPGDGTSFCDPGNGSIRGNPNDGGHSASTDLQTGFHDDPAGANTIHTEGRTNVSGRFVFGILSPDQGDSQILGWVDVTENDGHDGGEGSDTSVMHWLGDAPEPEPGACTVSGTSGSDVLTGSSKRDVICGRGGNDKIRGLGGNDLLKGGAGNDTIKGGKGNDVLRGKGGKDRLAGGDGNDKLNGGIKRDRLDGGSGRDSCSGGPNKDVLRRCE